ncbi:hypothetical protein MTR67_015474 [Solanum verrucosum]|uniref:Uncharacterized protein n=1 Tax=Solanum verrucosum TaxID=315347 RepID=A0AAF0TK41_SOLVR|nr:uncharacterized protein At3g17950 [Solanum verrucosum]WMV22089.1 hypothetical protein MTR67_015474 [Solanum verrucosum]
MHKNHILSLTIILPVASYRTVILPLFAYPKKYFLLIKRKIEALILVAMLDPATDLVPPPSSPTISSVSSSDLDTESTGSFFHDRSITLGTLMGVTFQAITFRAPSMTQNRQSIVEISDGAGSTSRKNRKSKKSRVAAVEEEERRHCRRRRWWRLCRDECDSKPASLGEYLEVERRLGDGAFDGGAAAAAAELEGVVIDAQPTNGRTLFADGRVLPPVEVEEESSSAGALGLCRFSVASLSGICSRGAGCVG